MNGNGTEQKIQGKTVDKTMTKPVCVVKNQEKPIILNKALYEFQLYRREITTQPMNWYINTSCVTCKC